MKGQNLQGGLDISSNLYFFQGMLYKNILKHRNPNAVEIQGTTDGAITEYRLENTFDRSLGINGGNEEVWMRKQKINNGIDYHLSAYGYDHLGRNVLKQFTAGLNYQNYNMRGFLNSIAFDKYDVTDTLFNEYLYYDHGFGSKLYNGNIAGITWCGSNRSEYRSYGYTYDNLNRLTHAEFNQLDGNNHWNRNDGIDYTASNITYDLNGNIKTMDQMVKVPGPGTPASFMMDQLTYTYAASSNQLIKVADAIPAATTKNFGLPDFKDGANTATEYSYDNNGNMLTDDNKQVTGITYNYLNKPEVITVQGNKTITYVYDAAGNRLQKKVASPDEGLNETWDYTGNFVYKDNELQYILNEEGRARPVPVLVDGTNDQFLTKFVYDYFVKDHLGNVRSTVTSTPIDVAYRASHEIVAANTEELVFDHIPQVREIKGGSTSPDNVYAARLNGGEADKRVGTALMLMTKAGDRFRINVNAFYEGDYTQSDESGTEALLESLAATLMGGTTPSGEVFGETGNAEILQRAMANPGLATQLADLTNTANNPDAPKAHLNYLWFNENLELDTRMSGSFQVAQNVNGTGGWVTIGTGSGNNINPAQNNGGGSGTVTIPNNGIEAPATGILVVYIDNQSIGKDVWFDDLVVDHYESEVVEEDHYYPFGLTLNTTPNTNNTTAQPYKYNGKELEKNFGLEMYDYGARMHDPQLGRMFSPDPMAGKFMSYSPYNYALNNPANMIDPDGQSATYSYDKGSNTLTITAKVYYQGKDLPTDAKERADLMTKINNDLKETYKDGTGTDGDQTWNVKFNVTAEINEDVKEADLKDGENIMTMDNDAPQLVQADGTKRQNVQGSKNNMGYLLGKAGTSYDPHEIGHMIGFVDRYSDYGSVDGKSWASIAHDGYEGDVMSYNKLNLNQSHYNDIVRYSNNKLIIGQKNLLPQFRSNTFNMNRTFDGFNKSETSPQDIPSGWIKK